LNAEREPLSDLVQEPDSGALFTSIVDLENAYSSAVIDRGELVEPFSCPKNAFEELHVHLQAMARLGLFIAFPTFTVRLVLLIGW
jgi:hypothetical protein